METKKRIMVVEDDMNIGSIVLDSLEIHDFEVTLFRNGDDAWHKFDKKKFDLVILDIMMPKKDGITLAREIKKIAPEMPIIFTSAKSQKDDKILGFKVGADDYLTKPFEVDELIARINVVLRRNNKSFSNVTKEYAIGKYKFNINSRVLSIGETQIKLTTKETGLLEQLCIQNGNVLTRDIALKAVWGTENYFTGRSMDVYITKIRKYLALDPNIEIQNVHGEGYRLIVTEPNA
ncbi:MAG: response regulator transcription factor [Chitinophagales bacterium]|jgi:DNA-binding response OmpR family regulator|nr:response regulator transcription factor [Chitinophagales bacterium]